MHPFDKKLLTFCRDRALLDPGDHLVVGVSGGADSMALLHSLAEIAPELGITMVVAHVDHGLRPEAAAKEADLVQRASTALKIQCNLTSFDVSAHAKSQGKSIEEAARELRYNFFKHIATKENANKIAVAHTADDQTEEVLLRMIRGAGRKGLSGMTLLRDGNLVRPLLGIEKSQILSYVAEKGIPFAQDLSNLDRRYLRNKIRLDLLPYLVNFNPGISQTLRQTANILQEEDALLDILAHKEYTLLVHEHKSPDLPVATTDCSALDRLPIAIARRVIEKMLIHVGVKPRFHHIESLRGLAAAGRGQIHLSRGLRAQATDNTLRLCYPWGKQPCRASIPDAQLLFSISIAEPGIYTIPEAGTVIRIEECPQQPGHIFQDKATIVFDAAKTPFPLTIRNRLPGDTVKPAGSRSQQPQKVSDILSGKKIPLHLRNSIPIVASGNKILAVLDFCIDESVKATKKSTTILRVTTSRI